VGTPSARLSPWSRVGVRRLQSLVGSRGGISGREDEGNMVIAERTKFRDSTLLKKGSDGVAKGRGEQGQAAFANLIQAEPGTWGGTGALRQLVCGGDQVCLFHQHR